MPEDFTPEAFAALTARVSKLEAASGTPSPHKHNRVDMYAVDYGDLDNRAHFVQYRALGPAAPNTVAVVGGAFSVPFGGTILLAGATVDTAGVTGSQTIDILKNGTSIMTTTKISIGSGNTDSRTAGTTQAALTTVAFAIGDVFTFSVTAVQTTPALGLTVFMRVIQLTP